MDEPLFLFIDHFFLSDIAGNRCSLFVSICSISAFPMLPSASLSSLSPLILDPYLFLIFSSLLSILVSLLSFHYFERSLSVTSAGTVKDLLHHNPAIFLVMKDPLSLPHLPSFLPCPLGVSRRQFFP